MLRVGLAGGGGVVGGPPGTVCAPGLRTRAGLAGRPSLGASLERMGPGGGGGQVGSDRQLSPASDTAVAEGTQPCFTVPGGAPARPLPAGSQEALRVPRAGVEVDVAQTSDSAASPLRQRPGLSPSRVVAAAGGRETEARSAEMRARLRAPSPRWAERLGRGAGGAHGASRARGAASGDGADVRGPRSGTACTALPGRLHGGGQSGRRTEGAAAGSPPPRSRQGADRRQL